MVSSPLDLTTHFAQGPNLGCFVSRVASHPERLKYIYFNTVLMLRALSRVGPYLSSYDLRAIDDAEDTYKTRALLQDVIGIANSAGAFDETVLFRGDDAKVSCCAAFYFTRRRKLTTRTPQVLKGEFKEHFRNVSRIMDCVGCDKCRLWGKIQVTGVAAALKILFEMDEKALE